MIPYSYNMVNMGGIDLAEANGTVVPGIYENIVEAINLCGDLILYDWKFAGINIAPSACTILQQASSILINGLIQVTELDQVTVIGLPTPIVPVSPLEVFENGAYEAAPPSSGFNPVTVNVSGPSLVQLTATENGDYDPVDYNAGGFSLVKVNVQGVITHHAAVRVWTGSTGGSNASVNVQEGILTGYEFLPTSETVNVLYSTVQSVAREFELITVGYPSRWTVTAKSPLYFSLPAASMAQGDTITWRYDQSVDYCFYKEE